MSKKLQRARHLTLQIAEFVEAFNIEGCQLLLAQRLTLLTEIKSELESYTPENKALRAEFEELLLWIEEQDKQPQEKAEDFKNKYQDKLQKQKKTNFAIKQYTSL